ncbi:MAG TPA: hypothetical protein PKX63_06600 [Niabella sp.]|nr:hypothetical protein [Niabella sp.]
MEIKILNSILFKELMPWTFDAKGTKAINEKIKKAGSKEPTTEAELVQQLQILLADYSDLSKWLTKQNTKGTSTLKNHCYAIDFPAYSDAVSKFYNAVISLETLRVYNAFNTKMQKYSKKVDIVYHTTIALKNIKALTVNTVKEIKERGFEEAPTEQSSLPHFVLQLLRQHLTILFFDIQELSKGSIDSPTSIEDFYLLDLNLPKAQINELQKVEIETEKAEKPTTKEKLSFGFKGTEAKLKSVITLLNNQVEFLNESKCSTEDLVTILKSKALTTKMHKVYFGCETVQLRYIIDELKNHFNNLTPTALAKSELFYTKTNKLLKAQNLYSNKIESPKNQSTIDNIINQMK